VASLAALWSLHRNDAVRRAPMAVLAGVYPSPTKCPSSGASPSRKLPVSCQPNRWNETDSSLRPAHCDWPSRSVRYKTLGSGLGCRCKGTLIDPSLPQPRPIPYTAEVIRDEKPARIEFYSEDGPGDLPPRWDELIELARSKKSGSSELEGSDQDDGEQSRPNGIDSRHNYCCDDQQQDPDENPLPGFHTPLPRH